MADRPSMLKEVAQARFDTDMIDSHTHSTSIPTLWEKSYLCPCRNRKTRQPDPSCEICHGRGVAFLLPENKDIIIQSQEKGVINSDIGLMDSGTAIGTPSDRSARISFRDRITVPSVQIPQSFIFDVSSKRVKHGFHMVYDVHEVQLAKTMDGDLVEDKDYTIDYDLNRFYPKEHLLEQNISLNILTTLRYMVADLLKEHRYAKRRDESLMRMPQKILLKREDIFVDKEAFDLGTDNEEVGEMIDTKRKPAPDGLNGFFRGG